MRARAARIERWFEIPVLVSALLVIPVLVVEESNAGQPWDGIAGLLNWLIWVVFATEVVVMSMIRGWRWAVENPLAVAIVFLTPPFLPSTLQSAGILRLLRLLRLFRVAPLARRTFTLVGLRYAAVLALVTVLLGGTAFASVEKEPTAWDGIWWAITTMTTVGYGDLYPETTAGRLVAIGVMVIGIGFLSMLIGATAERFLGAEEAKSTDGDVLTEIRALNERIARLEARLDDRST